MSNIFRKSYTIPIPPGAELITAKGVASARFKRKGKSITAPLTEAGDRVLVQSPFWYGRVAGKVVKLFTDAVASQQRLGELIRNDERDQTGMGDPYREHRKRRLVEHVDDWEAAIRNDGAGDKHVRHFAGCVRRIVAACKFNFMADISASRVQQYLADLREDRIVVAPLDPAKEFYTRAELSALLNIKMGTVTSLVTKHRLEAVGEGKQRRYPKATAEALCIDRGRGASTRTSNMYLAAIKAFCGWLVTDRRSGDNPVQHLSGGNVELDRRRDRRILDEVELRSVISAARASEVTFRGLTGIDRQMIYLTACASGFRASEVAALCPKDFNLTADAPDVTLFGTYTKNRQTAIQPLPPDVAQTLRGYLAGRPADAPIWPGTWNEKAADMLRIDLDACGIPYVIDGPNGPLHADFHALRHSYVAMLDRAGATLKEAMQLARHSDPKLTAKVYGKARLSDLTSTIDRLPSLTAPTEPAKEALRATGTDGSVASRLPFPCRAYDSTCDNMGQERTTDHLDGGKVELNETLTVEQFESGLDDMGQHDKSASCRARTYDPLIKSQQSESGFAAQNTGNRDGKAKALAVPLPRLASLVAILQRHHPEFHRLVERWATLSAETRAAIVAMVEAEGRP